MDRSSDRIGSENASSVATGEYSSAVETARQYYNSDDADRFYYSIWGGEDIHIGWYESSSEPIAAASRRTVARMADRVADHLNAESRVLDMGSGYGGAARYLAERFGCRVVALNLSEAENERCRKLNAKQSLDDRVEVVDGSFEQVPAEDSSFDLVWSQDAILHSGNRPLVIQEVSRVLKPGGRFVFTDPMQADTCPEGVLQPILDRIHLSTLGSPNFYRQQCRQHRLTEVDFEEATDQLVRHYSCVLDQTQRNQERLAQDVSPAYIERMKAGLRHWIEGGRNGYLAWGIFDFRK
ncbi:MAG: methyltransferase domain-containing protein [Pirellulaceae bacterium]